MEIINCEQGTYEWHALRAGRFTATDALELIPNLKNGKAKVGLDTLAYQIAAFKLTEELPEIFASTSAMERGKMLEPKARAAYVEATGQEVQEVGFCALDEYVGCSPDGLVGDNGLIEIKCKTDPHHLYAVANDWVDPKHEWQMQFQMLVTGREWCDYVLYNPNFEPNCLYIRTIRRDEDKIAKLQEGLAIGRKLVQEAIKKFNGVYEIK